MITRKRLEEILENEPFKTDGIDHNVKAISLLRKKVPYDVCPSIMCAVDYEILHLCNVEDVLPYIDEEDAAVLADCNLFIHSTGCLSMFV